MPVAREFRGAKALLRVVLPLCILAGCLMVLSQQVTPDMWRDLPDFMAQVPAHIWVAAALLTGVSLFSVGRYDGVAHRHMQTGVTQSRAETSGIIAISVAQTLGFGLFTGALARWRLLPDLSFGKALGLSAFVSVSFILGWAAVTALTCLLLPAPVWAKLPAAAVVFALPFVAIALFRWPAVSLGQFRMRMPTLRLTAAILFWSFVDMVTAAGALWLLLPQGAEIAFASFLPLYMLALGTALISNTPGGVGPFELILLGALPQVPADQMLQSIIAFRVVYYALPACLGAMALIRPLSRPVAQAVSEVPLSRILAAPRSEAGVITQNGGHLARTKDGCVPLWPTAQTVTALFAPVGGSVTNVLDHLRSEARATGRLALYYKTCARDALLARQAGWSVVHLADDAMLNPQCFSTQIPARRTLRRKLRAASKAGVEITVPAVLPFEDMARIDMDWCGRHGPARGGTMGRYSESYVSNQWVALSYCAGSPVAFVSFFVSQGEWALDLMRQTDAAPDGTMHALVEAAVTHARTAGITRLSLAATPACPDPSRAIWRAMAGRVVARAGGPGLRQFKSAFAPVWVPRYAAAPNAVQLALALADVAREVHNPVPLSSITTNVLHESDENYELASRRRA